MSLSMCVSLAVYFVEVGVCVFVVGVEAGLTCLVVLHSISKQSS